MWPCANHVAGKIFLFFLNLLSTTVEKNDLSDRRKSCTQLHPGHLRSALASLGNLWLVSFAVFVFAIVPYLYLHDESWQVQGSSAHWALDKGKYLPASGLQKIFMNIFVSCLVSGFIYVFVCVLYISIYMAWVGFHSAYVPIRPICPFSLYAHLAYMPIWPISPFGLYTGHN